eukprot:1858232-Amphidinium_carterae.1
MRRSGTCPPHQLISELTAPPSAHFAACLSVAFPERATHGTGKDLSSRYAHPQQQVKAHQNAEAIHDPVAKRDAVGNGWTSTPRKSA